MSEGFRPKKVTKSEIPPDIHKAYQGTSFSDEDLLSLATLLAQGKAIREASFTKAKQKLYEDGVKTKVQIAADRIKAMYSSKEGVNVNSTLFENPLLKRYVLSKQNNESPSDENTEITSSMSGYGARNRIRKIEDELGSTEVPENDKGRLEEERDTLKRQLADINETKRSTKEASQERTSIQTDATHAEKQKALAQVLSDADVLELREDQIVPAAADVLELSTNQIAETEAYAAREDRAQKFAEKYNISETRDAMLAAEGEYASAIKDLKSKAIAFPWKEVPQEVQEKYDNAILAWRGAITEAVKDQPKREQQRATIISFRDTILREEEARQRATLEASTIKDQKLFAKALSWSGSALALAAKGIVKTYLGTTKVAGRAFAAGHAEIREQLHGEGVSEQVLIERYTKASRVLSMAALGTVMFGGVASAGVGFSFLYRATRGTLGLWAASLGLGSAAGAASGELYSKTRGEKLRENKRSSKRNQTSDAGELAQERKDNRLGKNERIKKEKQWAEMAAAFLAGGSTSVLAGMTLLELTPESLGLPHHTPGASSHGVGSAEKSSLPSQHLPVQKETFNGLDKTVDFNGEGADRLVHDLRAELDKYPDLKSRYPDFYKTILTGRSHDIAFALGLSDQTGHSFIGQNSHIKVTPQGELTFYDGVHDKPHTLFSEKDGLHPFKPAHVHDVAHDKLEQRPHKAQVVHERAVTHHKPRLETNDDHEAVARANKAEFAREQKGQFANRTEVPPVRTAAPVAPPQPAPAPEAIPPKPITPEVAPTGSAISEVPSQPVAAPEPPPSVSATPEVAPQPAPAPESMPTQSAGAIETATQTGTSGSVDTQATPERPSITNTEAATTPEATPAPQPTLTPETTPAPADTVGREEIVVRGNVAETSTLPASAIDQTFPRPYLTEKGVVSVFGGDPDEQREIASIYARLHAGVRVRFTVPRHGFLGTIGPRVEEMVADKDGNVSTVKVNAFGKRFEAIDPSTFTSILK